DLTTHDLLLAGSGPELANLQQLAREFRIADRVKFLGHCDHDKTVSLFKGAELFALPSRADEGLPVVTAEAMAAGKATVATRTGGTPEAVLDNITGLLVERENFEAFRAALVRLIQNRPMRDSFSAAAKE